MKPKKKVLILEPSGNIWGSEMVLLDLLKEISFEDWNVGVCCPPDTPIVDELLKLPLEVIPVFISELHLKGRWARIVALKRFFCAIRRFKPDLIYLNQAGVLRIAVMAANLMRIPVVSSVKLVEDVNYIEQLRARASALPKIICVSRFILNNFMDHGIIAPDRLELVYDPYCPHFDWNTHNLDGSSLRADAFACIARVAYSKGQDVVLEALVELKKRSVSATVTFVGSSGPGDPFGDEMVELTKTLEVDDMAAWVGTKKDFFASTNGCAAWICPSRHDPFPRIMLAALDAGVFPIAWEGSGGPAEMIIASGGGVLYDRQEGKSLADAMMRVMKMSEEERKKLVENGRSWIRDNVDPQKAADRTTKIWEETILM